jgi:hypothetical protein
MTTTPGEDRPDAAEPATPRFPTAAARAAAREQQRDTREQRRAMHDMTRRHHGGRRADASRAREREEDDQELERTQRDGDQREDAANRVIVRQAEALVRAERSASDAEVDLRGALGAVLLELGRLETAARSLLAADGDARAGHADALRASARCIREEVERMLHPR